MDDSFSGRGTPELETAAFDYLESDGPDLLARWDRHQAFWDARLAAGLDSYARILLDRVGTECHALTRGQERIGGVNFASHDFLSLASHPAIRDAAVEAVARWGVHSAGPTALQGGSQPLLALEERLADMLCCRDATVFPTGWAAGYGAIRALVRDADHIVIDSQSHHSLQEAASNATGHLHWVPNCSHDAVKWHLARLRANHPRVGVLMVTSSLFATDSTVPDLRATREACREYGATLMVDVAHDLGAMGHGGLGFLGDQGMAGEVDVVIGSFSRTFASNGGFVASNASGLKQALRVFANPLMSSSAPSPLQASIILAALTIVRSAEGAQRRRRLLCNVMRLRAGLEARAFTLTGRPSGTVPLKLGGIAEARRMTRAAMERGALVNLLEYPVVSRNDSRWQLEVMADHTAEQIDRLVGIAVAAREAVQAEAED